jgi:hypothetical protein
VGASARRACLPVIREDSDLSKAEALAVIILAVRTPMGFSLLTNESMKNALMNPREFLGQKSGDSGKKQRDRAYTAYTAPEITYLVEVLEK